MPRFQRLNVLVEGPRDERFARCVLSRVFRPRYQLAVSEYAGALKSVIDGLIRGFREQGEEYILLADLDNEPCIVRKVDQIVQRFPSAEPRRIQVVVREIEGWYLAGLSKSACAELHLLHHRIKQGTDRLVKEDVQGLLESSCDMNVGELLVRACDHHDWNTACRRNVSLARFSRTFLPWLPPLN
jgi:hypothetical protein